LFLLLNHLLQTHLRVDTIQPGVSVGAVRCKR